MAARPHHFLLLPVLLLLLSASSASANGDVVKAGSGKVSMALYYESLCPFSAHFVVNSLTRVFKDGLLDAADLTLVPYGNAKVDAHGAITCQVCHRRAPDPFLCSSFGYC